MVFGGSLSVATGSFLIEDNMALLHMKGNLIDLANEGKFHLIVHGCNCFHTFGSGIAREIRERLPEAYAADRKTPHGDKSKVGTYSVMLGKQYNVVNAYTQFGVSRQGEDVFEYEGFDKILEALAEDYKGCAIGLPYIGMGLARGDATRIMASLERFAEKMEASGGCAVLVEFA